MSSSPLDTRTPRGVRRAVLEKSSRSGPAGSCAWARTRTRGGPGRTAGSASPSRGVRRDVARYDPHQVALGVSAARDPGEPGVVGPSCVSLTSGVASPAGRSIEARGEERQGVRASRARGRARPCPCCPRHQRRLSRIAGRGGARARPGCRASRRSRAAAGSGPWRRPGPCACGPATRVSPCPLRLARPPSSTPPNRASRPRPPSMVARHICSLTT